MSIECITINQWETTSNGKSTMLALATFVDEEMKRQGVDAMELSRRSEIPYSTLMRHLHNEVEEWKPSIIEKIAHALGVDFWRMMIIAGYSINPPGDPAIQDHELQELAIAFPWLKGIARDITHLTTEDREAIQEMVQTLRRRRAAQSKSKFD